MARAEMDIETTLPPERVRAALLDFSERRPELWPEIEPSLYEVLEVSDTAALIKEGSRFPGMTIWATERYDWSEPHTIRWTVVESNFCAPGSRVVATLHERENGGTRIHLDWERTGTSLLGRFLVGMIGLSRGKPVAASFEKALRKMESAER